MSEAERITLSNGVSLVTRGEGPSVFLMHGIGGNASSCGPLAGMLSDHGFRTFSWDAPGYGESSDPNLPFDYVRAAEQVITEISDEPVHVFGTSWGGVIGMYLAESSPERVKSLTVADSTRGSGVTAVRAEGMRERLQDLKQQGAEVFAQTRSDRLTSPATSQTVKDNVQRAMASVRIPGYTAAVEMMASSDLSDSLARITVPTLVLVGEDDIVTGVRESEILAENIPDSEFAIIPESGHAALQEQPLDVAGKILDFWTSLRHRHFCVAVRDSCDKQRRR